MSIVPGLLNDRRAHRAVNAVLMTLTASFLIVAGWSAAASAALNISVTGHRCTTTGESCPSPAYVYFDASATTCTAGECTDGWSQVDYVWDFGDPTSGTWVFSKEPMNRAYGPVAFHVFEPSGAGNYTVTVTATARNGATAQKTLSIFIDDPGSLQTRCIAKDDGSPNYTGCPISACVTGGYNGTNCDKASGSFITKIRDSYNANYRRILFEGGQNFESSPSATNLPGPGPVIVRPYGSGRIGASGRWFENNSLSEEKWTFVDIDWHETSGSMMTAHGAYPFQVDNWLLLRNSAVIDEKTTHWLLYGAKPDGTNTVGFAVVSNGQTVRCQGVQDGFLGEPCIWPGGSKTTLAGLYITGGSRLIRHMDTGNKTGGPEGIILQHMNLSGKRAHNGFETRGLESTTTSSYMSKMLISYNVFGLDDASACADCRGIDFKNPGNVMAGGSSKIKNVLVENNWFKDGMGLQIGDSLRGAVIRNNLFEDHVADNFYANINSHYEAAQVASWPGDLRIVNNTWHVTNMPGGAPAIDLQPRLGSGSPCYCENNLVWTQSGLTTACNNQCSAGATDRNNASRTGDTFPLLVDPLITLLPDALRITDWDLNLAATTIKAGPSSPYVIRDFAHRFRPSSTGAIGAMDPNGGTIAPPPSPTTPTPPPPPFLQ